MAIRLTAIISVCLALPTLAEPVTIRFVDPDLAELVPVRVEVSNALGEYFVAADALPLRRECVFAPMPNWLRQNPPRSLRNPYTGTEQHYVNGVGAYDLPPGRYVVRAFRGPEYTVAQQQLTVAEGQALDLTLTVQRWYNAAAAGWYAADDHLHIGRQSAADPVVSVER